MHSLSLVALALTFASAPLAAQEKISRRLAVDPDVSIRIVNLTGATRVSGWDADSVAVTGSAQSANNAVDIAKSAVQAMGGQGAGGRPDFAQGGAPDASQAAQGLETAKGLVKA